MSAAGSKKKRASETASLIEEFLSAPERLRLEEWRGREVEFFEARGRRYPERLKDFFQAVLSREWPVVVGIGPRGGGKTMAVSDAALGRFLWCDDDIYQLGGSLKQAREGFKYVRQILQADAALEEGLEEFLKEAATGPRGNWYRIAASSTKQARGQHPGDPHPQTGWQAHGGVLILDERDEMDDEIADAAEMSMGVADPGTIIITSTAHREDGGGIALLEEQAEAMGARVFKWDILDVSEVCTHDCAACPGGHAFAGALLGGTRARRPRSLPSGSDALGSRHCGTVATAESVAAWEKYRREHGWVGDEPAYCGGKAKLHAPGHMKMERIFATYRKARNKEIFEVEMLCRRRRGARSVVDPAKLDACLDPEAGYRGGYETVLTVDWGLKGWCVVTAQQAQLNRIVVVDVRYLHLAPVGHVIEILEEMRDAYGAHEVYADASHPYENLEVANAGFEMTECPFNQVKELGAGWLRGIVERREFAIPGQILRAKDHQGRPQWEYVFRSEDFRELWRQIKRWRRDKNGKIVKADDHGPDSVICAAKKFALEEAWEPESEGTGRRESFGMFG